VLGLEELKVRMKDHLLGKSGSCLTMLPAREGQQKENEATGAGGKNQKKSDA
jgi:hypothetical protein